VTTLHGPVADWATDLDHAEPEYNERAHEIWADLRQAGCPVAHSDRYGGMWAPVTHALVHEVAYDTDHFTSNGVVVSNARPFIPAPIGPAPPITSDPPFHQIARRILLPPFAPKVIDAWEPEIRRLCIDLLPSM
jgi:cytochrome P450